MFALSRARKMRPRRNASRTLRRKITIASAMGGTTNSVNSASLASAKNSTTAKPTMRSTSVTSSTSPALNISPRCSTSLVVRVTRRPTGWLSKNPMCSR